MGWPARAGRGCALCVPVTLPAPVTAHKRYGWPVGCPPGRTTDTQRTGTNVTVAGHDFTVTITNSWSRVPLCSCGWIGSVHPTSVTFGKADGSRRKTWKRLHNVAVDNAKAEWRSHCQDADLGRAVAVTVATPIVADLAFRMRHPSAGH